MLLAWYSLMFQDCCKLILQLCVLLFGHFMYENRQIHEVFFSTAIFNGGNCGRTVPSELIEKKEKWRISLCVRGEALISKTAFSSCRREKILQKYLSFCLKILLFSLTVLVTRWSFVRCARRSKDFPPPWWFSTGVAGGGVHLSSLGYNLHHKLWNFATICQWFMVLLILMSPMCFRDYLLS